MSANDAPLSRMEIESQIIAKAWSDESFAAALHADPRTAIAEVLGREIPEDLAIEVHNERQGIWHVVIPRAPTAAALELSEQDLAAVAGGITLAPFSARTLSSQVTVATYLARRSISLDPGLGP